MISRRRRIALIISSGLFFASAGLWVRGHFFLDGIVYDEQNGTRELHFETHDGAIDLGITDYMNRGASTGGWYLFSMPPFGSPTPLKSHIGFGYSNNFYIGRGSMTAKGPAVVTLHDRRIIFPIWPVVILAGVFPAWCLVSLRRSKVHWVRRDVSWTDPRLRARVGRFIIFSVLGICTGGLVGWISIRFSISKDQLRWTPPWVMLPIVALMAVFTRRRVLWHRAILWMALDFAGCACFFQATFAQTWIRYESHYLVYIFDPAEMLPSVLITGAVCYIFGAVLLLFLQVKPEPAKLGPYCPQCGYCLIGSTRKMCTECGRPFTLEELGISAEGLIPSNAA